MPEEEAAATAQRLEQDPLFRLLRSSSVVALSPFPKAGFAARKFAGWNLRASSAGWPGLLDGNSRLVRLIQRIGVEPFERCFLKDEALDDARRARLCGISAAEARELRRFVDRVFIQSEFERSSPPPEKVFSAVAGIGIEEGRPTLAFFHREVWKGRYRVDASRLGVLLSSMAPDEAERLRGFVRRLEFLDQRKTTLYRTLDALLEAQAAYLVSGDPLKRQPLTQRALAVALQVDASVLNRLLSNKSIQLPWGMEAPLKSLLPSAKALQLCHVEALACEEPGLSDEALRKELSSRHGIALSRRSVAQYRKDLGLGARGRRVGSSAGRAV